MKSNGSNAPPAKVDRKTVEKNRRIHMKSLCFKLGSLIPKQDKNTKDAVSQYDHLDQAACYIKELKARIERLKQRRRDAAAAAAVAGCGGSGAPETEAEGCCEVADGAGTGLLPVVEVRFRDPILEVVLVTAAPARKSLFYRAVGVLLEEGAEVANASFSVVNDKVFYTIHSQQRAAPSRTGLDASRVCERLKELLH